MTGDGGLAGRWMRCAYPPCGPAPSAVDPPVEKFYIDIDIDIDIISNYYKNGLFFALIFNDLLKTGKEGSKTPI